MKDAEVDDAVIDCDSQGADDEVLKPEDIDEDNAADEELLASGSAVVSGYDIQAGTRTWSWVLHDHTIGGLRNAQTS